LPERGYADLQLKARQLTFIAIYGKNEPIMEVINLNTNDPFKT
jgi:hypothetical protein